MINDQLDQMIITLHLVITIYYKFLKNLNINK